MLQIPFIGDWQKALSPGLADDPIDRLSYFCTTTVLLFFASLVGGKQYFGEPMTCMASAEYPGSWQVYVRDICFINGTFTYPEGYELLGLESEKRTLHIAYYQWVPFFLALQALLFYAPQAVWRFLQTFGVLELNPLVKEAVKCRSIAANHVEQEKRVAALILDRLPVGNLITWLFIVIKMLYVANVAVQFALLNSFFGDSYSFWGIETLLAIVRGEQWTNSDLFPLVTRCRFVKAIVGGSSVEEVQCVLVLNMLNEKIFLLIWWWLLVVGVAAIGSLIWRVQELLRSSDHFYDILPPDYSSHDETLERENFRRRMGSDGLLLFDFIRSQAGGIVAGDLLRRCLDEDKKRQVDQQNCHYNKANLNYRCYQAANFHRETEDDPADSFLSATAIDSGPN